MSRMLSQNRKSIAIVFIFLTLHVDILQSTLVQDPLMHLDQFKLNVETIIQGMPNLENDKSGTANDLVGLLRLRAYFSSFTGFGLDLKSIMHLPNIDKEMKLLQKTTEKVAKRIKDNAGQQTPRNEIIKINLKTASELAENTFEMMQEAVQAAINNGRCVAFGAVGVATVVGAVKKIGGGFLTGGVLGALIGAGVAVVPYAMYAHNVEYEAKMRFVNLYEELVDLKSMAKELYQNSRNEKVVSLIKELESFIKVIKAKL